MNTEQLLNERGNTHGDFTIQGDFSQRLKQCVSQELMFNNLNNVQREALSMILMKISRIVCGNPNVKDHWADIAGCATLIAKDLPE